MSLFELLDRYNDLLARKEELAALTTENNKEIEVARAELANAMIDEEVEKITRNGYSFSVGEKVHYTKKGGVDEALYEALRDDGLGDIIRETVNPRTLQATMKELAERNEGELPEQYREFISEYRFFDVGRRKA